MYSSFFFIAYRYLVLSGQKNEVLDFHTYDVSDTTDFSPRGRRRSSAREWPRFVAPIELDQRRRLALASTGTYSRCLRWCRACHDVIRGDVADEEEEKVEEDEERKDASLQPRVTISRESPLCRAEHRVSAPSGDRRRYRPIFRRESDGGREKAKKRGKKREEDARVSVATPSRCHSSRR